MTKTKTNHCPQCDGTGQMSYSVSNHSAYGHAVQEQKKMDCIICDGGKKPLSEEDAKRYKLQREAEAKLWCKCENSSGSRYVPDGASRKCMKHHWTCNDCGKITQVG